jgi:Fe-S-cluster containining protein
MTPDVAKAVSDLCVRCGLCCSGAIFDHGNLQPEEAEKWGRRGFTITSIPAKGDDGLRDAFAMPCQHLAGTVCSRYQQDRPAVCSSFFCKLATALADGSKSAAEAHALVAEANAKLAALRPYLEPEESWPVARARWRALEQQPHARGSVNTPDHARFRVRMAALNIWLNRHFHKKSGQSTPLF